MAIDNGGTENIDWARMRALAHFLDREADYVRFVAGTPFMQKGILILAPRGYGQIDGSIPSGVGSQPNFLHMPY
jgi:hypothetical protein